MKTFEAWCVYDKQYQHILLVHCDKDHVGREVKRISKPTGIKMVLEPCTITIATGKKKGVRK